MAYSVHQYGAVGDDLSNDRAGIQAAVDACALRGGGTVFIPAGAYRLDRALRVPPLVNVAGEGACSRLRAAGEHYLIALDSADCSVVSRLNLDSLEPQASGGGISFANAGQNIHLEDLWLGSNLSCAFDVVSANPARGAWWIRRVRWPYAVGCLTGFRIGDGQQQTSSVLISQVFGTAAPGGMATWFDIANGLDSVEVVNSGFYNGGAGAIIGAGASDLPTTQVAFRGCTFDSITGIGIYIGRADNVQIENGSFNTCGYWAVDIGGGASGRARGVKVDGTTIQNCGHAGVVIRDTALFTRITNCTISDNNTSNLSWGGGVLVAAGTKQFSIQHNHIGNHMLLSTGHQKYGVHVPAGPSTHYTVMGNSFVGNESGAIFDGGTGAKMVMANLEQ